MARRRKNGNIWHHPVAWTYLVLVMVGIGIGVGMAYFFRHQEPAAVTASLPIQPDLGWKLPEEQPEIRVDIPAKITHPAPDAPVIADSGIASKESIASPPAWLQNASAFEDPGDRPMIAIVLDDVGVAKEHAQLAVALPSFVTLALMTYADHVEALAKEARSRGHELLVHMPMEAVDAKMDAGPNALKVMLTDQELQRRIRWGLDRFSGYIGVNNHMGSRFTQSEAGMRQVLTELHERGLLFLDSKTIGNSVGDDLAARMQMPHLARDVFLDNDIDAGQIGLQLKRAEEVARRQGYAIAIGHPHPETVDALKKWIVQVQAQGFVLVPLSYILRKHTGYSG